MAEATLTGVVVAQQPGDENGIAPSAHDGLYLLTDEGELIALVRHAMYVQMSWEHIWRRSRSTFEALLGQRATIQGLRHAARHIQSLVGKELRSRAIPHLSFSLDESLKKQAGVLSAIREAVEEDQRRRGEVTAEGNELDSPEDVTGDTSAHSEDDVT